MKKKKGKTYFKVSLLGLLWNPEYKSGYTDARTLQINSRELKEQDTYD